MGDVVSGLHDGPTAAGRVVAEDGAGCAHRTHAGSMGAAEVSLPSPEPLVSVAWLADAIADPSLRVVDCRWYLGRPGAGRTAYDAGHLPGALHLDVDTHLMASQGPGRHPLPDPVVFRARME